MAEKNKNPRRSKKSRVPLETRIVATVALLDICRMDGDDISQRDMEELYKKVSEFNQKAFAEENEHAFNVVAEHGLDEIDSTQQLRERIRRNRALNIYKTLGYYDLASGKMNAHEMSGAEIVATILHENGVKNADELTIAACEGRLTDDDALRLKKILAGQQGGLKKSLAEDFATYTRQNVHNPAIEAVRSDIREYVVSVNKVVTFPFTVKKIHESFRDKLRDMDSHNDKPRFYKMFGTMLMGGRSVIGGNKASGSLNNFKNQMREIYGENRAPAVIDKALGISPEQKDAANADKLREQAYEEKCRELYFKMLAGILVRKYEYNQTHNENGNKGFDFTAYLGTIDYRYIPSLANEGRNCVEALAFLEPKKNQPYNGDVTREYWLKQRNKREMDRQKVATEHHKKPIGAAYDLYDQVIGTDSLKGLSPEKVEELKLKVCDRLTNNIGNKTFVIGEEMHDSLEPRGEIKITPKKDDMIFAAEVDCQILRSIMSRLPKVISEGLKKYVLEDDMVGKKKIYTYMSLPEADEYEAIRANLISGEKDHVSALQKFSRCYQER